MKIAAGAATLLMLAGCSTSTGAEAGPTPTPSLKAGTSSPSATPTSAIVYPEPVAPLTPADFRVTPKTLSKQCFGSAGCNVEVRLALAVRSAAAADRAAEITVSVTGDESGEIIETIQLDADGSYSAPEISLSTPRSGTQVKAWITDVTEV